MITFRREMAIPGKRTSFWQRWLINLNNRLTRLRRVRVAPGHLLLLVPHCVQKSDCPRNLRVALDECQRCGNCPVAALLALRDNYGIICRMATGGRQAAEYVKCKEVQAVVAVACEAELAAGICAAFPKPVLAIPNRRPQGPCHDTVVDLSAAENCLREMLGRHGERAVRP